MDGPALTDLQTLLQTDIKSLASGTSAFGFAFMGGCLVCGVIYERLNYELQIAIVFTLMAVFTMLPVWTVTLEAFVSACAARGIFAGFFEPAGTAYTLYIMTGHHLHNSAVQGLNLFWSVGGTIGPFIMQAFLIPREDDIHNSTYWNQSTMNNTSFLDQSTEKFNNTTQQSFFNQSANIHQPVIIGYAYLTSGLTGLGCSIPMWILVYLGPRKIRQEKKEKMKNFVKKEINEEPKRPIMTNIIMFFLLFLWFFFYMWCESLPAAFLPVWSYEELLWRKNVGPFLNSVFFGANGIGRSICALVAAFWSPRKMLIFGLFLLSLSYICLLIFHPFHDILVWVFVGLAGIALAFNWGSMIIWVSNHIHVSGAVAAFFLLSAYTGNATGRIFTGYMYQEYSRQWFLYILAGSALIDFMLFGALEILVHFRPSLKRNVTVKNIEIHNS